MADIDQPGDLLRAYQHHAKKQFGQHFLTDPRILDRIATGVADGDRVLEIGPGCGTLTWTMLRRGAKVTAVEIDRDAAAFLRSMLGPMGGLNLVEADVLKVDLDEVLGPPPDGAEGAGEDRRWRAVANLPYNVATEVLFRLLERGDRIGSMTLMFQKEVADRIVAGPGSKTYGALSIAVRVYADVERLFTLGPGAFTPPPKVDSAVVGVEPVAGTRVPDPTRRKALLDLVHGAFRTRRKTQPNALKNVGYDKEQVMAALEGAGIDPRVRPEVLSLHEFIALSAAMHP